MGKNFNFHRPVPQNVAPQGAAAELAKMLGVPQQSDTHQPRQIQMLEIHLLDSHPLQKNYSMHEDELLWLANNIAQNGVMQPIHVQAKEDGRYTIIAGHRRTEASRRAGLESIPAIIEQLDEDAAIIMFDSTNLGQRRSLSPSERAAAYQRIAQASERKNLSQYRTTTIVSQITGDHIRTIQRYKRLNHLIPEFLESVDTDKISFRTGVELSYLSQPQQQIVWQLLTEHNKKIEEKKAKQIKEIAEQSDFTREQVETILFPPKKESKQTIKIPMDTIQEYLPANLSKQQILEYILKAVQSYKGEE